MRLLWISALLAFAHDQAGKYVVIHQMELWRVRAIEVFPPLLNFRYGENYGINFGIGGDGVNAWVWVAIAAVICTALLVWVTRTKDMPRLGYVCAGLLIGGALGNVFDRLVYGYVLDFLNNSCCGFQNPFSYNVADVFVFVGAIGLVFLTPDHGKDARKGSKKGR